MKTFIVDSNNSLFATGEPLPPNFQRLIIEDNILSVLEAEVSGACHIVYPSFSSLLANSIVETGKVAPAQSSLLVAMEQIVQFYKRNRRCCQLLYLAKQNLIGQNISHPEILMKLSSQMSEKQIGIAEYIAAGSLVSHKDFSKRLAELESCSCGEVTFELQVDAQQGVDAVLVLQNENEQNLVDAETKIADIKAAFAREQQAKHAEQKEKQTIQQARATEQKAARKLHKKTKQQLQELEQENKQITEQLHSMQELFEEKIEQLTQTEQKLADAEAEIADSKAALAREEQAKDAGQKAARKLQKETEQQLQELEQENKQITEQLHSMQELFEEKIEQLTQTEQKLADAEAEIADSKAALARAQQAKDAEQKEKQSVQHARASEQKTARKMREQLQQELTEVTQESERLLEQVHYVQELLEQEYENKARQQGQIKSLSQERSSVFKQLEEARLVQVWLRSSLTKANHFLWSKSRTFRNEIKRQAKVLQESSEFVESQYIEMYPDIKTSSLEPAVHYLLFGAIEARNPSTAFHSLRYIQEYDDVAESGQNPLLHYIRHGQFEGRKPNPRQLRLPAPKG